MFRDAELSPIWTGVKWEGIDALLAFVSGIKNSNCSQGPSQCPAVKEAGLGKSLPPTKELPLSVPLYYVRDTKKNHRERKRQNSFSLLAEFCICRKLKGKKPKRQLELRKNSSIPSISNTRKYNEIGDRKKPSSGLNLLAMPEGAFQTGYLHICGYVRLCIRALKV